MRRLLFLLCTCAVSHGVEIGLKLGNANIDWKGTEEKTTLHGFVSFYIEEDYPVYGPLLLSPSLELGFGKRSVGEFYCTSWELCRLDLTYTTLELNGKGKFSLLSFLEVYTGVGVSYSRFGIEAYDLPTGYRIGTITDERGAGFQFLAGFQIRLKGFGFGGEYKFKRVDTESIEGVDTLTFVLSYRF